MFVCNTNGRSRGRSARPASRGAPKPRFARLIAARMGKNKKAEPAALTAASRPGFADRGFERGDADGKRLVFLARQPGHLLDRFEFLALDHVEVAQHAFGLSAQQRV